MKPQYSLILSILFLLILFPACWSQRQSKIVDNKHHVWGALEAKWYDIPLPVQVQKAQRVQLTEVEHGGYILRYRVNIELGDAQRFYLAEMETQGWRLYEQFNSDHEMLFIFEKPTKRCVISLKKEYNCIILTIYHREFVDSFQELPWEE